MTQHAPISVLLKDQNQIPKHPSSRVPGPQATFRRRVKHITRSVEQKILQTLYKIELADRLTDRLNRTVTRQRNSRYIRARARARMEIQQKGTNGTTRIPQRKMKMKEKQRATKRKKERKKTIRRANHRRKRRVEQEDKKGMMSRKV